MILTACAHTHLVFWSESHLFINNVVTRRREQIHRGAIDENRANCVGR